MYMSGILLRFAKQWIAGENAIDAIYRAKNANKQNITGLINYLGEHSNLKKEIQKNVEEYIDLLRYIKKEDIKSNISVKPTQIGLLISERFCYENLERIVEEAYLRENFVWIDMESSQYTQNTLKIYYSLLNHFDNAGIAIQAYLKRSENDVMDLLSKNGKIRLCKGAYKESTKIAFKSKKDIYRNYSKLMKLMFEHGKNFAIATHDDKLINEAIDLSKSYGVMDFEFQMLMGVRNNLKLKLVHNGYRLSEYIPYGKDWLPYTIRRLHERKRNILLILKSIFSQS
ncbi:MAG: proline dehydrogenase family protein [Methanosarcinales archaeon]